VKRCTLQAKAFFICSGSLSNIAHLSDKVQLCNYKGKGAPLGTPFKIRECPKGWAKIVV
jgi:hypothetical protein